MSSTQADLQNYQVTFLVVGGGIAGVTCAETITICAPEESILLLTESSFVKTIANLEPLSKYLEKFDVKEVDTALGATSLSANICIVVDQLKHIDSVKKIVYTIGKKIISYKYLCLCTGARPHLIAENNPRVLGIRDTDSVINLQKKLKDSESIIILGNGGIASELAYELEGIQVHWIVKDNHIASNFVDPGAAFFFNESMGKQKSPSKEKSNVIKRLQYSELNTDESGVKKSAALGPDWHLKFDLHGKLQDNIKLPKIHYNCHIQNFENLDNGLKVTLSNGEVIICDFLVSATGVTPQHEYTCEPELKLAPDYGIAVNEMMETNLTNIYAAGDVCTAAWPLAKNWFQMRLWTQARQMGSMAGRAMTSSFKSDTIYQDFCFELFAHTTKLFGYEVVLLGKYNSQGLDPNHYLLLRTTPGLEYIKFVVNKDTLVGAMLIGNTELAETCENLILNEINISPYGEDILNPDIDIEDYFD